MLNADLSLYEAMCSDDPHQVNSATRQLTRRVQPIAMRQVLANSGDQDDAHDLVQETVIDVWQQMRSGAYQPRAAPLEGYLYQVVRNKWLKILRQRQQHGPFDELPESLVEEIPDELPRIDQLLQAFNQLGEACQELLQLVYWDNLRMDEIANRLGILVSATKERKYRCMLRLGALLKGPKNGLRNE